MPSEFRMDIGVSYEGVISKNEQLVVEKIIPASRCARIRHLGSRDAIREADYLYSDWLPRSGEEAGEFPLFFHYVNVGPSIKHCDMITDVYLPLR